ncbi:hypothetical protein [Glutamicibacter uratoxydans]|uniref:hypothetical protein n=1 Tax=Glutamicibacter uratoxydans TaxID=43667 RepID=UPI003D6F333D
MSYRDLLVNLGDTTVEKVLDVLGLLREGMLSHTETVAVLTTIVGKSQAKAIVLAEASLAAELTVLSRSPVPIVPTGFQAQPEAVRRAMETTLAFDGDLTQRIERAVRGITYKAAADAYSDGVSRSRLVSGWVRDLEPDACQMCVWWWREGRIWPKEHPMPTHTGCTCSPKPVLAQDIASTAKSRAMSGETQPRKQKNQPVL